MERLVIIPLSKLVVKNNPRKGRRQVADLVSSIRLVGLRQPLEVRANGKPDIPDDERTYTITAGSRRFVALKGLQRGKVVVRDIDWERGVPCIVRDDDKADVAVIMLASNVYEDIPPSQKVDALKKIVTGELWPIERAALAVGETPARAEILLRLADAPQSIRDKVDNGNMSFSGFKRIAGSPVEAQKAIGEEDGRVTEEQAAAIVRKVKGKDEADQENIPVDDAPDILSTLKEIRNQLSLIAQGPVSVRERHVLSEIAEISGRLMQPLAQEAK